MKLSTRGDYAVRALLELATEDALECVPLPQLAERTGIPRQYLEQLLMRLRDSAFKRSIEKGGAYRFAA